MGAGGRLRGRRPAWEAAGALLVPDTRPYEAMKLRLVNGGHSALAYLGLLRGLATVADAVADPELGAFLERLFASELAPTLGAVPGLDLDRYREALLARFANRAHGATASSRSPPTALASCRCAFAPARELLATAREPAGICLVVAAWLRWLAGEGGRPHAAADPLHGEVAAAVAGRRRSRPRRPSARWPSAPCSATTCASPRAFRALLADGLAALGLISARSPVVATTRHRRRTRPRTRRWRG